MTSLPSSMFPRRGSDDDDDIKSLRSACDSAITAVNPDVCKLKTARNDGLLTKSCLPVTECYVQYE